MNATDRLAETARWLRYRDPRLTKTLDKFTISCHNPYEALSNSPRLTPPLTE